MKKFLPLLLLFTVLRATATVVSLGNGGNGGLFMSAPPERQYFTPWINDLNAEIDARADLSAGNKADAKAVVTTLTLIASDRTKVGTFTTAIGSASGEIVVELTGSDYTLPPGYTAGFLATLTLEITTSPPNSAPTITWTSAPTSAASGATYTVAAIANDADGNMIQATLWKNGVPVTVSPGDGATATVGGSPADLGPQTITYTAQAMDAMGASSPIITLTVTIAAPPPTNYTLLTSAGSGGAVSPGGSFPSGANAAVTAMPDALHDFVGWSGDAMGLANPVAVSMTANRNVQANFVPKSFTLVTTAGPGGSVSPGGAFPFGSVVLVSATPDPTHYFASWSGDASGLNPSVSVMIDGPKAVQASFSPKAAQIITFTPPGDHADGAPPFPVDATSSAGLPVVVTVVSGPAIATGLDVQVTGPGTVVLQASQPGDGVTLPAPPVSHSFNVTTAVIVRLETPPRIFLQSAVVGESLPFVIHP